ncbi:hypothetical protein JI735_34135 (plasmid) [Paenibacillus sonchi]|uniref:Uncharacterized protein n=1 Tax=Paenibacillus sonchi TaxID=373687 RepID=A0A974SGL0_9BACL|nr:hypothetical protein [Paenibacillus sonchi]QQZ64481.1 hypothetical protein JI735_34135 [Paenibacillus sonchi]
METSYYCFDQVNQMRATLDNMAMIKMIAEAGIDVITAPIEFSSNYIGDQDGIFLMCLERVFGTVENEWSIIDGGYEISKYRVPFIELKSLYPLFTGEKRIEYIRNLTLLLDVKVDDYYFYSDVAMEGELSKDCFFIRIMNGAGVFSPLLEKILFMRNEVIKTIRLQKMQLINNLKRIFIAKLAIESDIEVDFKSDQPWEAIYSGVRVQLQRSVGTDSLVYEELIMLLQQERRKKLQGSTNSEEAA